MVWRTYSEPAPDVGVVFAVELRIHMSRVRRERPRLILGVTVGEGRAQHRRRILARNPYSVDNRCELPTMPSQRQSEPPAYEHVVLALKSWGGRDVGMFGRECRKWLQAGVASDHVGNPSIEGRM
jgi:hypothetical protein